MDGDLRFDCPNARPDPYEASTLVFQVLATVDDAVKAPLKEAGR